MVLYVKADNEAYNTGKQIGQAAVSGFTQGADEKAIRNALDKLPKNASPREIIDTITGTRTYNPEAKQSALANYIKGYELEQEEKQTKRSNELKEAEIEAKNADTVAKLIKEQRKDSEKKEKADRAVKETTALLKENFPDKSDEEIAELAQVVSPERALKLNEGKKEEQKLDYQIAENIAKPFEPEIKEYHARALAADDVIPRLGVALATNEQYGGNQATWDALIDSTGSPFLGRFKSKTGQELEAIVPINIAGFASKMSGVLTNTKINIIARKAVGLGKDKNANRLMLYMDLYDKQLDKLRSAFSAEIQAESKFGLPPKDFREKLDKKMRPYKIMIDQDLSKLIRDEMPTSPLSQAGIAGEMGGPEPGTIWVQDENGTPGIIPKDEYESDPEMQKLYKKL